MSLEDWADLCQAKESQAACIRRYLGQEEGEQVSQPQLHRRATWKVLKALDHALVISTGRGLEGWVQKPSALELLPEPARALAASHLSPVPRGLAVVADQA
eukprot:6554495-Lingulodinium_polyedra.AAC.1